MLWFVLQCEKSVDPDSGIEGQPACDLRAVGKKFDKGLYTTLVSTQCLNIYVLFSHHCGACIYILYIINIIFICQSGKNCQCSFYV